MVKTLSGRVTEVAVLPYGHFCICFFFCNLPMDIGQWGQHEQFTIPTAYPEARVNPVAALGVGAQLLAAVGSAARVAWANRRDITAGIREVRSALGPSRASAPVVSSVHPVGRTMRRTFKRGRRTRRRSIRRKRATFRRGKIGRKTVMNPLYPIQRRYPVRRWEYQPPLGRVRVKQDATRTTERVKVVKVERWYIDSTTTVGAAASNIRFFISMSECHYAPGVYPACVPEYADFYRAIRDWHHFKYTGMKMEVFTFPQMPPVSVGMHLSHRGRAWSATETAPENTAPMLQQTITALAVVGGTVERAAVDPTYRPETFNIKLFTVCPGFFGGAPRRIFSRYVKANPEKSAGSTFSPVGWNMIVPNADANVIPQLWFAQKDSVLEYRVADLFFHTTSAAAMRIWFEVKKTFYITLQGRHPVSLPIPAYMLTKPEEEIAAGSFTAAETNEVEGETCP